MQDIKTYQNAKFQGTFNFDLQQYFANKIENIF